MGMFSNAIQNLSQLAIQESGVTIPQTADDSLIDKVKARLDSMTSLTEEEMYVPAEAVTVKLSNRLHKYLIEAEEISHFMITNGITNFKDAVRYILEANDLSGEYHNVAIIIDEASILDEMNNIGYAVSDFNLKPPPKGLGLAMVGKQKDFAKLRNIANTKELMDLLTGRYGLPLVKRNYTSVGLLNRTIHHEAVEETEIKPPKDAKILHEEDPKQKKPALVKEEYEIQEGYVDDAKEAGYKIKKKFQNATSSAADALRNKLGQARKVVNQATNNVKQKLNINSANESVDPHEAHIQWMREVAAGLHNDDEY